MSSYPSDQGGKMRILKLGASDWHDHELGLDKSIHITTEFGLRVHTIAISYIPKGDGFAPFLLLKFGFNWGLAGEGDWYNFVVRCGEKRLGSIPVKRMKSEPTADFVCVEPDEIRELMVWLSMDVDLVAEMHGSEDMACDFPIPCDPGFLPALRRVRERMVADTNAPIR